MKKIYLRLKWPYLHYNLHSDTCNHSSPFLEIKSEHLTWTCHSVLPSPADFCLWQAPHHHPCLVSWRFPCLLLPFCVSKPLMLSVVNGLASFQGGNSRMYIQTAKIYIYTGILKLIVYMSSRHGMTQCKQKVEIIRNCESCVLSIWVFCNFFEKFVELKIND